MKIKIATFLCDKISVDGLETVENEINAFTSTHNVKNIEVNVANVDNKAVIIYTVIYEVIILKEDE